MTFLRIELVGDTNQKSEELTSHSARFVDAIIDHPKSSSFSSKVGVDDNRPSIEDGVPSLPVKSHETSEAESIHKLKERLKLAELGCAKFGELYRTYRLRKLVRGKLSGKSIGGIRTAWSRYLFSTSDHMGRSFSNSKYVRRMLPLVTN